LRLGESQRIISGNIHSVKKKSKADELRPEYDLKKLKGAVRGKYAKIIEDTALVYAIREGEATDSVSRAKIFKIIKGTRRKSIHPVIARSAKRLRRSNLSK
jgi:hypothetical protein